MLRLGRVAATLAAGAVACVYACGGNPEGEGSGPGIFAEAGPGTNPDGPPVTPDKSCKSDADCKTGRCKDVGASTKACVAAKSCTGGSGADAKCGGKPGDEKSDGAQDCCETRAVPGGIFNRFNDGDFPASVSPFLLDTFELTSGRFRAWVEATNGDLRSTAPPAGGGAHPKIPNSGWRSEWDKFLPANRADVDRMLGPEQCEVGTNLDDYGALTWWTQALDTKVKAANRGQADVLAENTKDALDRKALNCVPWQVLFAFCVWDGGRLPTDAEWGYALAGNEHRPFPWGAIPQNNLVLIGENDSLSEVPIPAEVSAIHHITDDMVAEKPRFEAIASEVAQALRGCIPAAYNALFDRAFLMVSSLERRPTRVRSGRELLPMGLAPARRLRARPPQPRAHAAHEDDDRRGARR